MLYSASIIIAIFPKPDQFESTKNSLGIVYYFIHIAFTGDSSTFIKRLPLNSAEMVNYINLYATAINSWFVMLQNLNKETD